MTDSLQAAFPLLLVPVVALIVGGLAAAVRAPGSGVRSTVQHLAAGVVFAAVAVELLPTILHDQQPIPAIIGFAAGVGLMLAVKWVAERVGQRGVTETRQPSTLLIVVAIDLVVDGLLVGVGFAAGEKQGFLITLALSLEVLFIGLSVAAALSATSMPRGRIAATTVGLALLLALGAVLGVTLLAGLSGVPLDLVLAFGSAALLYLVIEELLIEAHEVPDTPPIVAAFFVGFLIMFLLDMLA